MKRYRVTVPYLPSMGSIAPFIVSESLMETKEEQALWVINSMREHDGLTPWRNIPAGLTYKEEE